MRKTLLVMGNEIRATLRRKTFMLFAFGVPLVLGIIALAAMIANRDAASHLESAAAAPSSPAAQKEGYVDPGGLIRILPPGTQSDSLTAYPDEAAAQAALEAGRIAGYFVIPADYVHTGRLAYVKQEHNPVTERVQTAGMQWILLVNLLGGDAALADLVRQPITVEAAPLASPKEADDDDSWITFMFPTLMVLIIYMVILMPAGVLITSVTDEKKNRVMETLLTSVSPEQLLTGKILALGLLGLLQTAAYVGVLWAVINFGGQPLSIPAGFALPASLVVWTLVFFLGAYAVYGALLAGVGALAADPKEVRTANLVVISPVIFSYIYMILILTQPNGLPAILLSLFPLTSSIAMIARLSVTELPLWQPILAAVLQLATAAFVVRWVARLFRAQHLLSGQPFSMRRYYRALIGRA